MLMMREYGILCQTGCAPFAANYCSRAEQRAEQEALLGAALQARMKQKIYCEGSLLDSVQRMHLFADCKHFVDMPLRNDAESTLAAWEELRSKGDVDVDSLRTFVEAHFDEPEGELEECAPADWEPRADAFRDIHDESYRLFATALHRKWPTLHRKIADKVRLHPERYSIIGVPNPFIVPGGRFREMYYWDSFFTIKGLLASKMYGTVRGMIENMQYLIEEFGFIPNGNRIYYLNRSQPPLLTWMLHAYYKATKDMEFVASLLPTLRKELAFFQANRSIMLDGWSGPLFRYNVVATQPRPESYREDIESAETFDDPLEKCRLWGDIAAAAESGRDFSSRWFDQSGPRAQQMSSTRTSQLIPVDLNAIICGNIRMMGELYDALGDVDSSKCCAILCDDMKRTMHQVLWNESRGSWFDFDLRDNCHLEMYQDTNFFPMVTGATHEGFDSGVVVRYLNETGVLAFPGGIPSSLVSSGQQWDFPNAWAPTSWVIMEGLRMVGEEEVAIGLAQKWVRKNYAMWKSSGGRMFEKYNVVSPCLKAAGGGGEYEMQEGFGWTNGVMLDLLTTYPDRLHFELEEQCPCCPPAMDIKPAAA